MWLDTFGTPQEEIVFYIFCGVSGLIVILSILNIILGCFITRNSITRVGGSMDFAIATGCIMLCFPVLVHGLEPEWVTEQAWMAICKIYHVILLIALTQFIGGLFVKGWTLFLFYKYNSDKTPISEEWIPNLLIWILILIAVAAAMVWEFLYTPELVNGNQCDYGEYDFEWQVGTSAWHGLLLVLALVALPANCAATRGTRGARESNILGIVVVNTVLTVVAGICIWFLMIDSDDINPEYKPDKTIQYAIFGGLMLWMCFFADLMFLISKMCYTCGSGPSDPPADNYDTIGADK